MNTYLIFLLFAYAIIPPSVLAYSLNLIYQKKDKNGWHLHYLFKYLITLSFVPVLFIPGIELGIIPAQPASVILFGLTLILAVLGIRPAIKNKVLRFYIAGIFAGFMEEILYRGIVFGLAQLIWGNVWISLIISSLGFGVWHLKNYWAHRNRTLVAKQFLYTAFVYGPLFWWHENTYRRLIFGNFLALSG